MNIVKGMNNVKGEWVSKANTNFPKPLPPMGEDIENLVQDARDTLLEGFCDEYRVEEFERLVRHAQRLNTEKAFVTVLTASGFVTPHNVAALLTAVNQQ